MFSICSKLDSEEIEKDPQRVSNIKAFIDNYRRLKNIRKNNSTTIALNVLYIKEKEICLVYVPKISSNCEK